MNKVIFLLLLLVSSSTWAARLVSDIYPSSSIQPDECGYSEGTGAPVMFPLEIVTGGKRCNISLLALSTGSHTLSVFARSAVWGDSTQVPFLFTSGSPSPPSGLRILR